MGETFSEEHAEYDSVAEPQEKRHWNTMASEENKEDLKVKIEKPATAQLAGRDLVTVRTRGEGDLLPKRQGNEQRVCRTRRCHQGLAEEDSRRRGRGEGQHRV